MSKRDESGGVSETFDNKAPARSATRGLSCPVCNAHFRGHAICSRCGADLGNLMRVVIAAWRLRQQSRKALAERRETIAALRANAAEALHTTASGRRLACLCGLTSAALHGVRGGG